MTSTVKVLFDEYGDATDWADELIYGNDDRKGIAVIVEDGNQGDEYGQLYGVYYEDAADCGFEDYDSETRWRRVQYAATFEGLDID